MRAASAGLWLAYPSIISYNHTSTSIDKKICKKKVVSMSSPDRIKAIQYARKYVEARPVYLDTETTGVRNDSEIIEFSILDHDGSVLVDTLVKPRLPIPADATRVHGITNEMVAGAPGWNEVWPEVLSILDGRYVGIYNVDFDLRLMKQSCQGSGIAWRNPRSKLFCLMKLYAYFYGERDFRKGGYRWQSLEDAGRQCGIELPNAHRSKDDTLLTRELLHFIARARS